MQIEEKNNIIVIAPHTNLDLDISIFLRYKINELFDNKEIYKDIIINLTDIEYICSTGLNIIMSTKKLLNEFSKTLKLSNPSEEVIEILKVVNFEEYFEIFKTEEEAIRSFSN